MQDHVCVHLPLTEPKLGLLHSVPFDDTKNLGNSTTSLQVSLAIFGDGSHLLPPWWGRDGVELVALLIGYVRVFVI